MVAKALLWCVCVCACIVHVCVRVVLCVFIVCVRVWALERAGDGNWHKGAACELCV
jgi:hypothetical protein